MTTGELGPEFNPGQVITVFRSRRRHQAESDYRRVAHQMEKAARAADGFVDFKTFTAEDGEHVSLVTFATSTAHRAWRDDPGHRRAQQQGREPLLPRLLHPGGRVHARLPVDAEPGPAR